MLKRSITGVAFKRILKSNQIQPSVFAFKTKIELTQVKQTLGSEKSVPKVYIDKLEELFNITDK